MSLNAEDRRNLFRTDSLQLQIQKFLLKRADFKVPKDELREFFGDVSNGAFQSALIALDTKGIIRNGEGEVILEKGSVRMLGAISDKVWRAIRIEKTFSIESLSQLTGLQQSQVRTVVGKLVRKGHVFFVGWSRGSIADVKVYQVSTHSLCRPTRDSKYLSDIDAVWNVLYLLRGNSITSNDVNNVLQERDSNISARHLRRLLQDLSENNCIELRESGRQKVYWVPEDLPPKKYGIRRR